MRLEGREFEDALFNEAHPPPPVRCDCGQEFRPTWYRDERFKAMGVKSGGVWAFAHVNPCKFCEVQPDRQAEIDLARSVLRTGIPQGVAHFRHDLLTQQNPGELLEDFMARAKTGPWLGVSLANLPSFRQVVNWLPKDGWLVLHGPNGVGKTALMAALIRKLLTPGQTKTSKVDLNYKTPEAETYAKSRGLDTMTTRPRLPAVSYIRMDDLMDRERRSLRNLDAAPVVDTAKWDGVLFLDELAQGTKVLEPEKIAVERVICWRYDRRLPTVIATNRTTEELCDEKKALYGRAVADRLRAATHVNLGGDSWR